MSEHYPRHTVSASAWCAKCQKQTQHRIDNKLKGPCLVCMANYDAEKAVIDFDALRRKLSPPPQISLFEEIPQ